MFGDTSTQTLNIALGSLAGNIDTYYVRLGFTAEVVNGANSRNTAEYLIATIDSIPETIGEVPLPAALPLYGTGLAIIGFIGWRRKRKSAA